MTRRQVADFAVTISTIACPLERARVSRRIANIMHSRNPRFDYRRFYEACGVRYVVTVSLIV